MTSKPIAKKFRIRRTGSLTSEPGGGVEKTNADVAGSTRPQVVDNGTGDPSRSAAGPDTPARGAPDFNVDTAFDNANDGFGDEPFATAATSKAAGSKQSAVGEEIEAIRSEGLTGRQLRMARRVAQKHGLEPASDYDAVRLLRKRGVDPFERSTMLELVIADDKRGAEADANAPKLPKTVDQPQLPTPHRMDNSTRAREVFIIQRDIRRRRRRKLILLFSRLAFFVLLPTFIAGYYFYNIATPLYATKSEFLIQKADAPATGLGGLFSGTGFATSQDAITVQSYLQSREAMLRLDEEIGYKNQFSGEHIDPILRLTDNATNEEAYRLFGRMVTIGYDPTEGIVKMEVIAPDPQISAAYSLALIKYAEEQVDHLTQRLRADQMEGAVETFQDSEAKMKVAQTRVLELQQEMGVLDPTSETGLIMSQVTTFEVQLQEKRLQLRQLEDNARPNQARVDGVKGDIQRLEAVIAELRSQMTSGTGQSASLAQITGELRMAEVDLQTRQVMMQQALQQLETSRIEANRQVRYLSLGVFPVAPDEPTYPRKFENTALAMLIFLGIYLMFSLTASILREQVSA